jgi:chromosome segregation ATPase
VTRHNTLAVDDQELIDADARAAALEVEMTWLRSQINDLSKRLDASLTQRASLEAVITERLESERRATTQVDSMRAALLTVTERVSELSLERDRDRAEAAELASIATQREEKLRIMEVQLTEVESFLSSSAGAHTARLEDELADARLCLASAESDKDDLEQELAECQAAMREAEEYQRILAATHAEGAIDPENAAASRGGLFIKDTAASTHGVDKENFVNRGQW